jgi:hypothetical protein
MGTLSDGTREYNLQELYNLQRLKVGPVMHQMECRVDGCRQLATYILECSKPNKVRVVLELCPTHGDVVPIAPLPVAPNAMAPFKELSLLQVMELMKDVERLCLKGGCDEAF